MNHGSQAMGKKLLHQAHSKLKQLKRGSIAIKLVRLARITETKSKQRAFKSLLKAPEACINLHLGRLNLWLASNYLLGDASKSRRGVLSAWPRISVLILKTMKCRKHTKKLIPKRNYFGQYV
jgi:hypothetical protein